MCPKHNSRTACFNANGALAANLGMTGGGVLSINGDTYIANKGWVSALLDGKISTAASCNKNWNWSGQGGQPTWLWGGNDGINMYVYNPANFSVNYATSANVAQRSWGIPTYTDQVYYVAASEQRFAVYTTDGGRGADSILSLGGASTRWSKVYAASSTISTSDRNLKKDIKKLRPLYKDFFMKLIPVSYLFKDGESGRTHIGFISQDVEDAMDELGMSSLDFAGFCKDVKMKECLTTDVDGNKIVEEVPITDADGNEEYIYSLRYEEFVALNTAMIQDLYYELSKLKASLHKTL